VFTQTGARLDRSGDHVGVDRTGEHSSLIIGLTPEAELPGHPLTQGSDVVARDRVSGIGFSHQLVIAIFGGPAPLIAAAFVGAGHPTYVALYMIAIVAVCLAVYFTLPETGSKTLRATVALEDPEVVEGELKEATVGGQTKHSLS
jgi:MFS transporter, MHS family, alpha-ketoglutarate permease